MLLLDEPFGALDAFTREELWCVLRDLWAAQRFTVILVTHDLREAVFLADTVYVMSKRPGRILARREIDLPRPRDLEVTYTDAFTDIVHELREHIGARAQGAERRTPTTASVERCAPWSCWRACCWSSGRRSARSSTCRSSSSRARSRSRSRWCEYAGPIAGHAWQTFWTTMAGFALGVVVGLLLGLLHRQLALRLQRRVPAAGRVQRDPQGGVRADPRRVVRHRHRCRRS